MKKIIALVLAFSLLTACSGGGSVDLSKDFTPNPVQTCHSENLYVTLNEFSAGVFKTGAKEGENTLVSPASLLYVLAMITNGARGDTLAQIENVLGCDSDSLNSYLHRLMTSTDKVNTANAIWVRDGFKADSDFLQKNVDYFGAGVYSAPFDKTTVKDINNFVDKNTNGMINEIVDRLDRSTVMCLVNALAFEGQWEKKYEKSQINDGVFTAYDGSRQDVQFMHSRESIFLQDENTTGFVKPYKNGYSFVALLPSEGVAIEDYLADLTGEKLTKLIVNSYKCPVEAIMPAFKTEYTGDMIEVFKRLGITDIFDPAKSDLSKMGESDYGLYIDTFLHKTYIDVDANGTKAAAVSFATANESASADFMIHYVRLDRPFVYMIVHDSSPLPLFIGSVVRF